MKKMRAKEKSGLGKEKLLKAYKLFFGTLTSRDRLLIINLLRRGQRNVGLIQKELRLEQTRVSHSLRRLKRCGFVDAKKEGKNRVYKLNAHTIRPLMDIIDKHMDKFCMKIVSHQIKKQGGR